MTIRKKFRRFGTRKSWAQKVLAADNIWVQVKQVLAQHNNLVLPTTPRRPDVRLIIENMSGHALIFKNPGDHSGGKAEQIPSGGDKKAIMVMLKGETLQEQYKNAQAVYERFSLGEKGASLQLIEALNKGELKDYIDEAYGPAPFDGQVEKLVDIDWTDQSNIVQHISPHKGQYAAYGTRAATDEMVFLVQFPIHVKGTGTTPECVESDGICIAVSSDWQTGEEHTRPIVPSVAKTYYGVHFDQMPIVHASSDGVVQDIDLKNGHQIIVPRTYQRLKLGRRFK